MPNYPTLPYLSIPGHVEVAADGTPVEAWTTAVGTTITVYANSTWVISQTGLASMSGYEALAFSVKYSKADPDDDAVLLLRTDTGLERIGKAAPVSASNGSLTNGGTSITGRVDMAETGVTPARNLVWTLKGLDTTPNPDQGAVLATGTWHILPGGVAATS